MAKYVISAFVADFDGTVTEQDTIDPMARLAIGQLEQSDAQLENWLSLSRQYQSQSTAVNNSFFSEFSSLESFVSNFHKTVEMPALEQVVSQKFLMGLKKEQLHQLGQKTKKKKLVEQVLIKLRRKSVRIEILSANWSTDLIIGAGGEYCDLITANDLLFTNEDPTTTTGEIKLKITSAQHKLNRIEQVMNTYGKTAFIGDSINDILAICRADIGILIGQNQLARQALGYFEIPVVDIQLRSDYFPDMHSGSFIGLSSWSEVDFFLKTHKLPTNHEPSNSSL